MNGRRAAEQDLIVQNIKDKFVETFHIAAQYLATVAISFLDKKEDDSHTNLGWRKGALHTRSLSEYNCVFSLDYQSFSLIWSNDLGYKESISLDGKKHAEIIHWIRQTSLKAKQNRVYEYKLHYELPYKEITSDYTFIKPSGVQIKESIQRRNLAQEALKKSLLDSNVSIRIWPHHFDSGAFFMADDEIGIGLGMAIPDTMIQDFYLYASGYKGHDSIELPVSTSIEKGKYHSNGWKGFALPVSGINTEEAVIFYTNAINQYLKT